MANMVPTDKIMTTKPISKIKAVATKDRIPLIHNNRANIEMLEKILPNLIKNSLKSFLSVWVVCKFCISSLRMIES